MILVTGVHVSPAAVTDAVARTTGRPRRTLAAFAAEHAARFGRASQ